MNKKIIIIFCLVLIINFNYFSVDKVQTTEIPLILSLSSCDLTTCISICPGSCIFGCTCPDGCKYSYADPYDTCGGYPGPCDCRSNNDCGPDECYGNDLCVMICPDPGTCDASCSECTSGCACEYPITHCDYGCTNGQCNPPPQTCEDKGYKCLSNPCSNYQECSSRSYTCSNPSKYCCSGACQVYCEDKGGLYKCLTGSCSSYESCASTIYICKSGATCCYGACTSPATTSSTTSTTTTTSSSTTSSSTTSSTTTTTLPSDGFKIWVEGAQLYTINEPTPIIIYIQNFESIEDTYTITYSVEAIYKGNDVSHLVDISLQSNEILVSPREITVTQSVINILGPIEEGTITFTAENLAGETATTSIKITSGYPINLPENSIGIFIIIFSSILFLSYLPKTFL